MSKPKDPKFPTVDLALLDDVTGGTKSADDTASKSTSGIDGLITQLNSITSEIKNIDKKTKGFSDEQMMMLCLIAMDRRRW